MREDVKLEGWTIRAQGGPEDAFLESVFFSGNGRMGARGCPALRARPRPADTGLFIAGIFGELKPGITDIVNLPTPLYERVLLNGEEPEFAAPLERTLDLASGLLTLRYTLGQGGGRLQVEEERFFSLANPALLLQRTTLWPQGGMEFVLESGVELACCNRPVPDDQVKERGETVRLADCTAAVERPGGFAAEFSIRGTGLTVRQELALRAQGLGAGEAFYRPGEAAGTRFAARAAAGSALRLEKAAAIATSRDLDPLLAPLPEGWAFDELLEENRRAWAEKWARCDAPPCGGEARTALRYVIHQLIANCSARDDTVSIGARGLTHTRYKGCYFWDTDLFMLPFYLENDPAAARSLVRYRVNTLPQAKAHAKKMNGAGARYPWMTSLDGTEQCESWDIGCSEVHITADVAYAAGQYMERTGDRELFLGGGAELLVETARFWGSRYSPEPGTERVNLLFCKGPDEYCGITSNNLFTNAMARHNLELALAAAEALRRLDPEQYLRLGLGPAEAEEWRRLHAAIKLPRDPETGRLRQDDTFHLLEPVDPAALKDGDQASYHKVCFDRVQRYRAIKQADVILLMTRLPGLFTREEKLAAWAEFEPLCLHDSTLSFATHALFAFQNGLGEQGEAYLEKALFLDLRDVMGNTGKEGLHLACMGEAWQAAMLWLRQRDKAKTGGAGAPAPG